MLNPLVTVGEYELGGHSRQVVAPSCQIERCSTRKTNAPLPLFIQTILASREPTWYNVNISTGVRDDHA
jgi:hypothetical protein